MLWFKALHIISMVCWFAGLFYLPRLYVYHANSTDIMQKQFKIMEWRLFWYIMTPAAVLTGLFGWCIIFTNYHYYETMNWLHIKLILVLLLAIYHVYLAKLLFQFRCNQATHSEKFYRYLNEVPTIFLIAIVLLAVIQP
ncbi:MAG: protoporphyrinogen oxidase HemJ [Gammaproteobacteria bacterium]|nr:protoporphyrinogen oxidase HemJ [Gammaproteobacteria bacterium]